MKAIEIALSQIGIKEVVGGTHNPEVLKYFQEIGCEWVKDDETAWCSAFVNWCQKKARRKYSGKLNARSWLIEGIEKKEPSVGDIVILWRESPTSWIGHVGFFCREANGWIYVLGGNQNNSVSIQAYRKHRLLQYRTV